MFALENIELTILDSKIFENESKRQGGAFQFQEKCDKILIKNT